MQTRSVGRPDTGRFAEPPSATGRMTMTDNPELLRIQCFVRHFWYGFDPNEQSNAQPTRRR
ncbi:hypothetical protein [Larkinella punicea]|uniref:hypothetical protein n=1 Tax=Larkinella punicea TaxID=2315727 RepID=UPI0010589F2D|nr:hypothetical protein [Larkinella punicea]